VIREGGLNAIPSSSRNEMVLSCDIDRYDAEIPPQLFRFLREPTHSAAVTEGSVWLSTLRACRAYEAEGRGDPGEAIHEYDTGQLCGVGDDAEFGRRAAIRGVKVHPGAESIVVWHNRYTWTLVGDEIERWLDAEFEAPAEEAIVNVVSDWSCRPATGGCSHVSLRPRMSEPLLG